MADKGKEPSNSKSQVNHMAPEVYIAPGARAFKRQAMLMTAFIRSANQIVKDRLDPTKLDEITNMLVFTEVFKALVDVAMRTSKMTIDLGAIDYTGPDINPATSDMVKESVAESTATIEEFDKNFNSLLAQFQQQLIKFNRSRDPRPV